MATLTLASCGSGEIVENDDLLTGRWLVDELIVDGGTFDSTDVFIELSTVRAAVRVDSDCHSLFGSFTLTDQGQASFTMPGASTNECAPADQVVEDALLEALAGAAQWEQTAAGIVIDGPSSRLALSPAG